MLVRLQPWPQIFTKILCSYRKRTYICIVKKVVMISEEQERFLRENRGLLFEYYIQASNPTKDTKILGDLQVWVYGDDRAAFTPHCHVMTIDKSVEFEVSLIDWRVINIKRGEPTRSMQKRLDKWLTCEKHGAHGMTNKEFLFFNWDGTNPNNRLSAFCAKHAIVPEDKVLLEYIESQR